MSIVLSVRPTRSLPFTIDELHGPEPWRRPRGKNRTARALALADRVLGVYGRRPGRRLRAGGRRPAANAADNALGKRSSPCC